MGAPKQAKTAIIMTVFDRPELTLMNTLYGLSRNDLKDTAIIIVDDGSTVQYGAVPQIIESLPAILHRINTKDDRPDTYTIDENYNNPAYAFNAGFAIAKEIHAEKICVLSSDVIIPPHAMEAVGRCDLTKAVLCARVVDMDSAGDFCSSRRLWPLPWFVATLTEYVEAIGGWDEAYLAGIGFEDNDFMARLFLAVRCMIVFDGITTYHQSHPQTAYSDNFQGWNTNEKYTIDRWGCVPFRVNNAPYSWSTRPVKQGQTYMINPEAPKFVAGVKAAQEKPKKVRIAQI
jgi:GT2 family glycosyltransferase